MPKITPFLWFDGKAEQAAKFYVSVFPNSKIKTVVRAGPGPKAPVMTVAFKLDKQEFVGLNGGPMYKFTEATSFVIDCKDQKEIDFYWKKLLSGGGEPSRCGWLKDRFGLSWQVVPVNIGKLIQHPAAMQAMLGMDKIDLKKLQDAANGPKTAPKARAKR